MEKREQVRFENVGEKVYCSECGDFIPLSRLIILEENSTLNEGCNACGHTVSRKRYQELVKSMKEGKNQGKKL